MPRAQNASAPTRSAASRNRVTRVGSVSPTTAVQPEVKMPDLSLAMSSSVGPSTSVWS